MPHCKEQGLISDNKAGFDWKKIAFSFPQGAIPSSTYLLVPTSLLEYIEYSFLIPSSFLFHEVL